MSQKIQVCVTCRFWKRSKSNNARLGQCRRFPPPSGSGSYSTTSDNWPRTEEEDWCGEWQKNESTAVKKQVIPDEK